MKDEKAGSCGCFVQGNDKEIVLGASDLTHVFNVTAPTSNGSEVNVNGYSFIRGEDVYYKIDVVINEKKDESREYISTSPEKAIQEAMVAIATFCQHFPEKVVARSTMALPPIEENKSMRYQLMSEDIKGRVIAWFSSEGMAEMAREAYNFICDYSVLYKTNDERFYDSTSIKYLPWVYGDKVYASIDLLDKEDKVVFNASLRANLLFFGYDVICHSVKPESDEMGSVDVSQHEDMHDAKRHLFLILKNDLDDGFHFLTPPELYVENVMGEDRYEVKFKDYNVHARMSFDTMGTAIEFAQELRNLFEYKAEEKKVWHKEYKPYGEPLRIKDCL